jgi:hypothetical protein
LRHGLPLRTDERAQHKNGDEHTVNYTALEPPGRYGRL